MRAALGRVACTFLTSSNCFVVGGCWCFFFFPFYRSIVDLQCFICIANVCVCVCVHARASKVASVLSASL